MPDNMPPHRFRGVIILLIAFGTAVFLASPVSADPTFVTIAVKGSQSYYLGEEVVISGVNSDSDTTYLFITGSNLANGGGKLSSPYQMPVSGDPGSFTAVKTKPDNTWEYTFYTFDLRLDAGVYTIYAVSKPKAKGQLAEASYGTTSIVLKKPFITAGIAPPSVLKGQPFTITGTAEGNPSEVRIWIIGDNYVDTTPTPVNSDASFTFNADAAMSGNLPAGQYYLIVQHPMQDNEFDIDVSGENVRNLKLNNGTNLFKITGSGSLKGSDAADALVDAFKNNEAPNDYTGDTYAVIPFQVTGTGNSSPQAQSTATAPLQFATFGAIVLVLGIMAWRRR